MDARLNATARDLDTDLHWLAAVLQRRLDTYFGEPLSNPPLPDTLAPPDLGASDSPYALLLRQRAPSPAQRLILLLALAPQLRPQLLDVLWARNNATQRGFSEFGGIQGAASGHFIPTGETACFLLAGDNLGERLRALRLLADGEHRLMDDLLQPLRAPAGESPLAAPLRVTSFMLAVLGIDLAGDDAEILPAQRVGTGLDWDDLVLPPATLEQL